MLYYAMQSTMILSLIFSTVFKFWYYIS